MTVKAQVEEEGKKVVHDNAQKSNDDSVNHGRVVMHGEVTLGFVRYKRGRKYYKYARLHIPLEYLEKVGITEDLLRRGVEAYLEISTEDGEPIIMLKPKMKAI